MYERKGLPWTFKGVTAVGDCVTSEEVIQKANLDWDVAKCELFAKMPIHDMSDNMLDSVNDDVKKGVAILNSNNLYKMCPNGYCTYRTDKNIPLGVVKSKYTIVQNREAFSFFDSAIKNKEARWDTAGCFGNGNRVFISAKLPSLTLVKNDPVDNYLVFVNSHDGSGGVKIMFTPIRLICFNALTSAIKSSTNYISFRHTASVHRNIDEANEILGICERKRKETEEYYNYLANTAVTDEEVMKFIGEFALNEEEAEQLSVTGHTFKELCYRNNKAFEDSGISMRKLNVISDIWNYYNDGIGQKQIAGTAWGAVNAVSGYYSNVDNAVGEKRFDSIIFGDKSRKIQSAFDMAGVLN